MDDVVALRRFDLLGQIGIITAGVHRHPVPLAGKRSGQLRDMDVLLARISPTHRRERTRLRRDHRDVRARLRCRWGHNSGYPRRLAHKTFERSNSGFPRFAFRITHTHRPASFQRQRGGYSDAVQRSEEFPDDVPVADAYEQQRTPIEPAPDEEDSAEPPDAMPLEATAADWQEQLETVELDPELDEFER